jgi:rhodanese-related sulfurtransferase
MVDLKKIQAEVQSGKAILLDVREEEELVAEGMAEGALWMPTSKMDADEWRDFKKNLPKEKTIVVYCRSGARSGRVAALLSAEGFLTQNAGGLKDWKAAGLPIKQFA